LFTCFKESVSMRILTAAKKYTDWNEVQIEVRRKHVVYRL